MNDPIIREKKEITWNVLPCQHERVSSRVDNYRQNTSASFTDSLIHSTFKAMKNENSVIIYSPSSSSKPVWMSLFCWTQRKILWRMRETEQFWCTIDYHSIYFSYYGSQWCPKNSLVTNFLPLCSAFIQVWNYLRVSKWGQHFHFWVNYLFNKTAQLNVVIVI